MSNNSQPLVSIVITCYNHQDYIAEAIDSIMNQSYPSFELIISDDGSTDKSPDIIRERISFYNNDSRIIPLLSPTNTSFHIVDQAFSIAKGKYICGIGGDDKIALSRIEKQVEFLEGNPVYKACFTWVECIGADENKQAFFTNIFNRTNIDSTELLRQLLINGNCLCAPSFMMDRNIFISLGGYDFYYKQLQDYKLWLSYLLNNKLYIIQEPLTYYRIVAGSLSDPDNNPGVQVRSIAEREEILYKFMLQIDEETFNVLFPDEDNSHHTNIDLKCRQIKLLLEYSKHGLFFGSTAIRLFFHYHDNSEFDNVLNNKYGITRKQIYNIVSDLSLYNPILDLQHQALVWKTANSRHRFNLKYINVSETDLVSEILDILDSKKGAITIDHIIGLYDYCKQNGSNDSDFIGLLQELQDNNIEIFS